MKKVCLLALLLAVTTCTWAAANPKATGDYSFTNPQSPDQPPASITFNAINTKPTGLGAKGSLIYTDANVTYTMDVQFLLVSGSEAYFAGQVTSVTYISGQNTNCCKVGNWVFYHVHDGGQPGIGVDTTSGEDLTQGENITDIVTVMNAVALKGQPLNQAYIGPAYPITDGNILVH